MKKEKYCWGCTKRLPVSMFYADASRWDGLNGRCIKCTKDRDKARPSHVHRQRKYETKYPEKQKARVAVKSAVERGDLKRKPCEICGSKAVHAHHEDYSKPLQVRWLCQTHHAQEHHK